MFKDLPRGLTKFKSLFKNWNCIKSLQITRNTPDEKDKLNKIKENKVRGSEHDVNRIGCKLSGLGLILTFIFFNADAISSATILSLGRLYKVNMDMNSDIKN